MVFDHDSFGKIHSEWKTAVGQEEFKTDYLVYRYQDGRLAAKESGIIGSNSGNRKDAIQYFYDSDGRLVKNIEFDPQFGFQQKSRTEYFYHPKLNK